MIPQYMIKRIMNNGRLLGELITDALVTEYMLCDVVCCEVQ